MNKFIKLFKYNISIVLIPLFAQLNVSYALTPSSPITLNKVDAVTIPSCFCTPVSISYRVYDFFQDSHVVAKLSSNILKRLCEIHRVYYSNYNTTLQIHNLNVLMVLRCSSEFSRAVTYFLVAQNRYF